MSLVHHNHRHTQSASNRIPWQKIYEFGHKYGSQAYKAYEHHQKEKRKRDVYAIDQSVRKPLRPTKTVKTSGSYTPSHMPVTRYNHSSQKVVGKTRVVKVKKRHVSAKFKASVKEVLSGVMARGTYTTLKQGYVGSMINNGNNTLLSVTDLTVSAPAVLIDGSAGNSTGSRTLFNCLVVNNPGANPTSIAQTGMNYFTPAKVLDAASVLFNNKPPGDPYLTTGNMSDIEAIANAVPVLTTPNLKIEIVDSSVVFRMKNLSTRVATVEIWELTPTQKFGFVAPLSQVLGLGPAFAATQNDGPVKYFVDIGAAQTNQFHFEQAYDPFGVAKKYMGFPFVWKKRTMIMMPDETSAHTIVGPKGVMDFKKLMLGNPNPAVQLNALVKGFSVAVVISVNGDQVYKSSASGIGSRDIYMSAIANRFDLGMPISIEIEEKYRLAVPEIAGFISIAPLVGASQMLNLRKTKFVFWNQIRPQGPTDTPATGYITANSENPLAASTSGNADQ